MKELQKIINDKVQQMVDENVIQEAIEKNIETAIQKAIESQFASYGNMTNQIEDGLKEGLMINISDLPFESYNQQMLVAVKQKLGGMFAHEASTKFMQELDKTLAPAPKEITIKELVETIAGYWKTDEPWNADELDDNASVELEKDDKLGSTSYSLKMWKQKYSSPRYGVCSEDIHLHINSGKIRISHNQSYNPTCFREHEAFVFKLYAAGTLITGLDDFDPDDYDLTLKDDEY